MGNIGWTGIIIIAILVVILFGKGKISSIMGDLAKGIKSFKAGMKEGENEEIEISAEEVPSKKAKRNKTSAAKKKKS